MQPAHQRDGLRELVIGGGKLAAQQRELAIGEQVEMFVGDGEREAQAGRVRVQRAQLQLQAFAQRARGDARRDRASARACSTRSTSVGVGGDFGQQRRRDVVERVGDVAVVVDRIDDRARDRELARREIRVFELADRWSCSDSVTSSATSEARSSSSRQESEPALRSLQSSSMTSASTATSGAGCASTRFSSGIGCGSSASNVPVASYSSTGSSITLLSSCSRMCACSSMRRHLQEADRLLQLRGHRQRLTQLQLQ